MTKTEFYSKIEELIESTPGSLDGTEPLTQLEGWDSLTVLSFLAMADATFGTMVTAQQLTNCRTVSDLLSLFPGKISGE